MTVISFPPTMTNTSPWVVHVWFEDPVGNRDPVGTTEFRTQSDAIESVCATLSRLRDTDASRLGGHEAAEMCVAQLVGPAFAVPRSCSARGSPSNGTKTQTQTKTPWRAG
jgi:hypothetical protein